MPITAEDHALGPASARVTLVEYGDFECPSCGQVDPVLHAVLRAFGPNLRFVFRHFPLRDSHPHAVAADAVRVERELIERTHAARVERDLERGRASGVRGTPSLFINGVIYEGPRDRSSLVAALAGAAVAANVS